MVLLLLLLLSHFSNVQLCDPIDSSPPGSPVPGVLQARTLEWVAISFSNAGKWKVKVKSLSCVWLLVTPWTAAYQAFGIFQARVLEWGAIAFSMVLLERSSTFNSYVLFAFFTEKKVLWIKNYDREFLGSPVVRTLLSLMRVWGQSLVGEIATHKPHAMASLRYLAFCQVFGINSL